jgi:hypothetical protein
MTDHYGVLGLNHNASVEEVRKSFRNLALTYHPDRNKAPNSAEKFIEIVEAFEALSNEKRGYFQPYFHDFSIEPGKVIIEMPNKYSTVVIKFGDDTLYGTLRTSQDNKFSVVFSDGHFDNEYYPPKWMNGKVCLIEIDNLLWIKDIERPTNASISNYGRIALLYTIHRDASSSSPTKEFIELGGTLSVIEKSGETVFTYEFGSNIEGCAISPDGELVSVATLYPDNSIYCFEIRRRLLLWKYRSHIRKIPILGLNFSGNQIDVFTGSSISTMHKEYELNVDGTLPPKYQQTLDSLEKTKKQRPQEKIETLLAMVSSDNEWEVNEGLSELTKFAKTKGSIPYYNQVVSTLGSLLQKKAQQFDAIWKVAKQILKVQPEILKPIVPDIISQLKECAQNNTEYILSILGELGGANPSWIKADEQYIKQKLRSQLWNERRFAILAVGSIGSVDSSFAKDVIPFLTEYASDPEGLTEEIEGMTKIHDPVPSDFNSTAFIRFTVPTPPHMDPPTMIRDACVDALGMIGKRFPDSVNAAVPLLKRLSTDAPSPYTIKKATRALEAIIGKD